MICKRFHLFECHYLMSIDDIFIQEFKKQTQKESYIILFSISVYYKRILSCDVFNYNESVLFFKCIPNLYLIQVNAAMKGTDNYSNVSGLKKI